jgi:hypothetical protein
MARFIKRLRNTGNVRLSCEAADVPRSTVYRWRDKWSTFADEWDEALEDACDLLEEEAWRRAIDNGSDRLLMFLLKAHRQDKYGDRQELDITTNDALTVIIKQRGDES